MPVDRAFSDIGSGSAADAGALVVIVGASGSGKDTLINWLRQRLESRPDILFVRRTVTRAADGGPEDHDTMSEAEFETAEAEGRFAVTWAAHGLRYGLPASVHEHLGRGGIAIANGSRKALPDLRARFRTLRVVHLIVDADVLAGRLAARGRESAAGIKARLERAGLDHDRGPDIIEIDNSGPIHVAGNRVVALVESRSGRAKPVP